METFSSPIYIKHILDCCFKKITPLIQLRNDRTSVLYKQLTDYNYDRGLLRTMFVYFQPFVWVEVSLSNGGEYERNHSMCITVRWSARYVQISSILYIKMVINTNTALSSTSNSPSRATHWTMCRTWSLGIFLARNIFDIPLIDRDCLRIACTLLTDPSAPLNIRSGPQERRAEV